ncbi:hypothetical protein DWZ29_09360, partial [Anaerobutyricum hallii]
SKGGGFPFCLFNKLNYCSVHRKNNNCRRQRRRPRRESSPYICDFSRGGLNVRFKCSHPNLAPRPQICFIYLPEGVSFACGKFLFIFSILQLCIFVSLL